MRCDRCGKGVLVGMNVSHSHRRTKKRSYPNIHSLRAKVGGGTKIMHLCTKCLRIVKRRQQELLTKQKSQEKTEEKEPITIPV